MKRRTLANTDGLWTSEKAFGRHCIADEQLTRRLGWIMGGGVTIYIYMHMGYGGTSISGI